MNPSVRAFFDDATNTVSYVVYDDIAKQCAIIDPVLDYDPASGRTMKTSADALIKFVEEAGLRVSWILETHIHADHVTAAPYIKETLGGVVAIGSQVTEVQNTFGTLFNLTSSFSADGSQFDRLLEDGDSIGFGAVEGRVLHTPGHTPACATYIFGNAAFVGDTLFMPDFGTARTDFPGGNAATLYQSIQKLFSLPDETRLFLCHDYKSPERDEFQWETTVKKEKEQNIHVHSGVSEAEFVTFRTERDANLSMPKLILPAVQVNIRAGAFPPAESNGTRFLKIPVDVL